MRPFLRAYRAGGVVLRRSQQPMGRVNAGGLGYLALGGPWHGPAQTAAHGDRDRNEDGGDPASDQRPSPKPRRSQRQTGFGELRAWSLRLLGVELRRAAWSAVALAGCGSLVMGLEREQDLVGRRVGLLVERYCSRRCVAGGFVLSEDRIGVLGGRVGFVRKQSAGEVQRVVRVVLCVNFATLLGPLGEISRSGAATLAAFARVL